LTWDVTANDGLTNFCFSFEKCTYYFKIAVALAIAAIPEGYILEGFTLFPVESSASADGRILVRKIVEGQYEDAKLIISDQTLLAIQIVGDWDSCHPHVCWHSQIQVFVFSYWSSSLSN